MKFLLKCFIVEDGKYQLSEDKKFSLVSGVIFFHMAEFILSVLKKLPKNFIENIIFDILSEEIEKRLEKK